MQLYATELMGAETYDDQGNFVGRVREFFIEPADQPNRVARLLLARGRFQPLGAKYDQLATAAPGTIRLNCNERALELYQPNEGRLAVATGAGGCRTAGSGAAIAAGNCVSSGCTETAERLAATDDSMGVREPD